MTSDEPLKISADAMVLLELLCQNGLNASLPDVCLRLPEGKELWRKKMTRRVRATAYAPAFMYVTPRGWAARIAKYNRRAMGARTPFEPRTMPRAA